MRYYSIALNWVLLFAVAFLNGCKSKKDESPDINGNSIEPNVVTKVVPEIIVVTVNGVGIVESDLERKIQAEMKKMGAPVPDRFLERYKRELRQKVLNEMIVEILLDKEVEENGIVVTEQDVDRNIRITNARKRMSMEDFLEMLEAKGEDLNEYKENLRRELGYEKLMDVKLSDSVNISEEDARKYYSENTDQFQIQEQVCASQILVGVNPDDSGEVKEKARAKARDLLGHIANGADFSEIAREYSDCPSASKGGDLGFFPRGVMAPVLEKVAFESDVGQVSDIIETEQGLHIIKVTGRKAAGIAAFEEVRGDVMRKLIRNQQRELSRQYIEQLKEKADITYGTPGRSHTRSSKQRS